MKKKLDTRFPAARIKKIMQADEDVGKIALAVPLLVSKALELFLQDLCNRTREITLRKGAKTINSLHLKQCVQNFNVFDFLREIVGKVPDLGGSETPGDDHSCPKRRKVVDGENDTDNESKRSLGSSQNENIHAGITPRGRSKGRGRGRHRGTRGSDRDMPALNEKLEDYCEHDIDYPERADDLTKSKENVSTIKPEELPSRNFDLNIDLDENGDSKPVVVGDKAGSSADTNTEDKQEEYPGWSLSEVEKMAIDPQQLANFDSRVEYEEDDYDAEG